MHSDPIADMLTRIRNGLHARLHWVTIPHSALKEHIAQTLLNEGYIEGVRVMDAKRKGQQLMEVLLKYDDKGVPVILNIKRCSTPGLRRYYSWKTIPKIRKGLGVVILTTSQGVMTDHQARQAHLGGEALCIVC